MLSIADLIQYRRHRERLIDLVEEVELPTAYGQFKLRLYTSSPDGREHLALVKGDLAKVDAPLVRVHSECLTGDVLGSLRCDCGNQLHGDADGGEGGVRCDPVYASGRARHRSGQ